MMIIPYLNLLFLDFEFTFKCNINLNQILNAQLHQMHIFFC